MVTLTEEDAQVFFILQADDIVLRRNSYGWGVPRWAELTVTRVTPTMLMVGTSLAESRYRKKNGQRVGASDPWTDRVFPDTPKFREQMAEDTEAGDQAKRKAVAKHALHHRIKWGSIPLEVVEEVVAVLAPYLRS